MMKKTTVVLMVFVAGISFAQTDAKFLRKKIDGWFAESKPATKAVWVTDAKGCLVSDYDPGNGIQLIPMLDESKKPICRK